MSDLLSLFEAIARIEADMPRMSTESVDLFAAAGRVLAEDVVSPIDLPPFDTSAMDGYAVRAADAGEGMGVRVVQDIRAGGWPDRALGAGQAARIMTGAPLPDGADSVVPVEDTDADWRGGQSPATITVRIAATTGGNVRKRGENVARGQTVLRAGHRLRAVDVGMLGSLGLGTVAVARQPRVAILTSGDELAPYGRPLRDGEIYDGNTPMLAAMLARFGAAPDVLAPARDTFESVRSTFEAALALKPDMIVSSAGVSVGAADFVKEVLDQLGEVGFWRINLRPGKPLAYGRLGAVPFFGLPGNPVSAFVTCELIVKHAVYAMLGRVVDTEVVNATTEHDIESDGRRSYLRCALTSTPDGWTARLTGTQSSGALYSLVVADGLLIVDEGVRYVEAGQPVQVQLLR
ncbi:MAG: molybdopterin molybdotransferase MoeA [Chloroflexi bacterium]|nr:molybdopterin molybdotransferase MoeA [Chloroflexota bacterium]